MPDIKNEYTKGIKISFNTDKNSFNKVKQMVEDLGSDIDFGKFDLNAINDLKNIFSFIKDADFSKENFGLSDLSDKEINNLKKYKSLFEEIQENQVSLKRTLELDEQLQQLRRYDELISELTKRQKELSQLSSEEASEEIARLDKKIQEYEKLKAALGVKISEGDSDKETSIFKEKLSEAANTVKESFKEVFGFSFKTFVIDIFNGIKNFVTNIIQSSWQEFNNMLKYSRYLDSGIFNQQMTYGFSNAQNYAFSKVKDLMNITDDESIYRLTSNERQKFYEKFNEYTEKYNSLYNAGFFDTLEEFEWEKQELFEDLQYEIMDFFMDNKEMIHDILYGLTDFGKVIVNLLGGILSVFGSSHERSESERQAALNQIWSSNNVTNNDTKNVNINNTFNNVSNSDKTWLANAGSMTFQQIIRSLGG